MRRAGMQVEGSRRAGHEGIGDAEVARRASVDAILEIAQPDLLDRHRPRFVALRGLQAVRARGGELAVLPLERAVGAERVLGGRDREHEEEEDARGGEEAAERHGCDPQIGPTHGQTSVQPGPRKKVPMTVRSVAMTTNQVMIHSGRVTRWSARRRRPPSAPPRAANIAPAVRSVGTAIAQQPKAPKRMKRAAVAAARALSLIHISEPT